MNTFGQKFRLTTFGESHGPAIGGVIDGFPAGIAIDFDAIAAAMEERRPGRRGVSPRKEDDMPQFLSGISPEGISLGTPIGFVIWNKDTRSVDYGNLAHSFRPNHADYTYFAKYGIRDHRGGGRASARETACRVVGGAFAAQLLKERGIEIKAFLTAAGKVGEEDILRRLAESPELASTYQPSPTVREKMEREIEDAQTSGDSVGGAVTCIITGLGAGIGEPIYDKLTARLASAMMGINAAKAFESGLGRESASMRGSRMLDNFENRDGRIVTSTNFSGGIQGGISNGMPIFFNVYFKPTPTIGLPVALMGENGEVAVETIKGRHDPCVAVRAVPVVKAMAAMTLADLIL